MIRLINIYRGLRRRKTKDTGELQFEIFLSMRNSGADVSPDVKFSRFAVGYGRVNIKLLRKPLKNSSPNAMAPATGVYATAADLCKFTRIFYQKTPILSEKSK